VIAVSSITGGDPDLFINYGDSKLPTKQSYDFASTTSKSEITSITLKDSYFMKSNLKSMRGHYIIGVYGKKKSNFTLSLTQEKYPIRIMTE
jgi:hypothetical protein